MYNLKINLLIEIKITICLFKQIKKIYNISKNENI